MNLDPYDGHAWLLFHYAFSDKTVVYFGLTVIDDLPEKIGWEKGAQG